MNAASIPRLLLTPLVQAAAEHFYGANEAGDITVVAATSKVPIVDQHRIDGLCPAPLTVAAVLCPATLSVADGMLTFRTAETLLALGRP
jgi:hypothetical protein